MAITFEQVIQSVLNELGAVEGANAVDAATNFNATPSTATVNGPDFIPDHVEVALAATISETVECIAATPHHPERLRFADETASLANHDPVPEQGSGGERIIGVPSYVRDASDNEACLPMPLDVIRSYNRFPTIYADADTYGYSINGDRIEHTREAVVMGVCVYTRPTAFTGAIDLNDEHEGGLVAGTVEKLALKESMYADLYASAKTRRDEHIAKIRSYGDPSLYGKATAAPSST